MNTGKIIRRLRLDADMTLAQLAGALGVSMNSLWRWETGRVQPRLGALKRIAAYFAVPVDWFLVTGSVNLSGEKELLDLYGRLSITQQVNLVRYLRKKVSA